MEPATQDPRKPYSPENPFAPKQQYSSDNPYAPANVTADNANTSPGVESRFDNVLTDPKPLPAPPPDPWMVGKLRPAEQKAITLTPHDKSVRAPNVQLDKSVPSPNGDYEVVNTTHAIDGHVPTHRVDQPTNKLPTETWEQYEARVLARKSFSPDTAARSDTGSLEPDVRANAESLLAAAKQEGVNLSIGETRRTQERQEMLFQKGRSSPGSPVTWTLTSNHTPGRALDLNGDPSAYTWLQKNAAKFGFSTLGDMDPGHIAIPSPAAPKPSALPTPKLVADALPHENVPATGHTLPEPFKSMSDFLVQPAMDNPLTTALMFTPPGAIAGLAQLPAHAAEYAGQKAAELTLPPDVRAMAEKDPDRIPGRQIATELGGAALLHALHVGFKGPSIGEGMMESGVKGAAAETHAQLKTGYTKDSPPPPPAPAAPAQADLPTAEQAGPLVTASPSDVAEYTAQAKDLAQKYKFVMDKVWETNASRVHPETGKKLTKVQRQALEKVEGQAVMAYRRLMDEVGDNLGPDARDALHAEVGADVKLLANRSQLRAGDEPTPLPAEQKALPPTPEPPAPEPKSGEQGLWAGPTQAYMEARERWEESPNDGKLKLAARAELAKLSPEHRETATRWWYDQASQNVQDATPARGGAGYGTEGATPEVMRQQHLDAQQGRNRARAEVVHGRTLSGHPNPTEGILETPPAVAPPTPEAPKDYSKDNPFITTNFDKETTETLGHGRPTRVLLGDGQKLPARYRVMSADDLQSSHDPFNFNPNPKYPEGVQGRDYQRNKPAQEAMAQRALNYDADRALNPSESAGEGAPTVLPDGTVIAGNERSILPRRAMQQAPQKYAAYVEQLKARAAEFGVDPAHVDQVKNPVLVRELTDARDIEGGPKRWAEINQLSDEATTKSKSASEEGVARSAKLMNAQGALDHLQQTLAPDSTLAEYLGTADGKTFIRRLIEDGVISREDVARFSDGQGGLTEDGRNAVRRMLQGAAITDPAVLTDAPAGVVSKLEHAVPAIVSTRGGKFDISRLTTAALRMVAEARANRMTIDDLLAQTGMFGDSNKYPDVVARMARALDEMRPTEVKAAFRKYATLAREALDDGNNMFGSSEYDTPRKAFDAAFTQANEVGDEGFYSPAPEMRGGISAEEMASRAKAGETRKAVRDLTGREPEPRSKDRLQEDMFGSEPPPQPAVPKTDIIETNFDDQLGFFAPSSAKGAVDLSPRPAPTMERIPNPSWADVIREKIGMKKDPQLRPLIDISRNLAKALDVPLHQERALLKKRRALGVFYPHSESVRVRRYDAIRTVAHEVGHYISKRWLGNPTMRKDFLRQGPNKFFGSVPASEVKELVQMGKDLYGSRKPTGGYGEEGVAEFAAFYVTDPALLAQKAPQFLKFMEDGVFKKDPMLKEILDHARDQMQRYTAGTPQERVRSMMSVGEADVRSWNGRRLVTNYLDDVAEFKRAMEEIEKQRGTPADAEKDAYTLARLAGGAGGAAEDMLKKGVVEYGSTVRNSMGLEEVIDMIPRKERTGWREFLLAHRTLEKSAQGINTGITREDAAATVADGKKNKNWQKAAEEMWKISNALIDYRQKGGLLTFDEASHIKKLNRRRVPMYRVFDAEETGTSRLGSGKPQGKNTSGLFKMKGSARKIVDPIEGMVQDIYQTARQVAQHQPIQELVRLAHETEGGARIAELVPTPLDRMAMTANEVKAQLRDLGFGPPGWDPDIETFDEAWDNAMDDHVKGILEAYRDRKSAGPSEQKDMVVSVLIKGHRKYVQIGDRQLYEAFKGLSEPQYNQIIDLMGMFTRTLRAGATLTAEFATGNVVRDAQTAATFSRTKRALPLPGEHLARGLFHLLGQTDLYHEWKLSGGDQAAMLAQDRSATQKHVADLEATHVERLTNVVRHPIETLRMVSSLAENATRLGEHAALRKEGHGPRSAAFGAREVTQDFRKAGTIARSVNQIIPFETARIGGMTKLYGELKTRPSVILPRILAYTTLPSIALYLAQKDDPDYKAVPEWQHAMFHIIVDRDESDNLKHIWRIPRAPGLGQLFGYLPIQVLKYIDSKDPRALRKAWDGLSSEFNPAQWPTAILPIVEAISNKSLFRDRKIVPAAREHLQPSEQFAPHTGEFARQVGRWSNTSPAMLENTAQDYGGGLAQYALGAADAATRQIRENNDLPALTQRRAESEDVLNDLPVTKRFTVRRPGTDAESVQQFYEEYNDAVSKYDTWNHMRKDGRHQEAVEFMRANRKQIEAVATAADRGDGTTGPLRRAATMISKIQQSGRGGRRDEQSVGAKVRAIAENPAVVRAYRHPITRP